MQLPNRCSKRRGHEWRKPASVDARFGILRPALLSNLKRPARLSESGTNSAGTRRETSGQCQCALEEYRSTKYHELAPGAFHGLPYPF